MYSSVIPAASRQDHCVSATEQRNGNSMKFRHQSLRNPGQSLDEQIDRVVLDEWAGYVLAAACLWLVAIFEWASRMFDLPRIPAIYALAAVVATTLLFWKTRETRRQL